MGNPPARDKDSGRVAGLRAVRLIAKPELHADMAGDKAEPLVKPVRIDARFVARQLDEPAALVAGDLDRAADKRLAHALPAAGGARLGLPR